MWQVFDRFHDLSHYGFGPLVWVFEDDREPADPFDKRRHIRLAKLLFKQHLVTFPVAELTAVGYVIRSEQDADITVKLGRLTFAGTARCAVLSMQRQLPPQLLGQAFLGVDIAVDCLLTHT